VQLSPNNSAVTALPNQPRCRHSSPVWLGLAVPSALLHSQAGSIPIRRQSDLAARTTPQVRRVLSSCDLQLQKRSVVRREYQFTATAAFPVTLAVPAADRAAFGGCGRRREPPSNELPCKTTISLCRSSTGKGSIIQSGLVLGITSEGLRRIRGKTHQRLTLDFGGRIDWDGERSRASSLVLLSASWVRLASSKDGKT
jgi:hypothetical protein